MKDLATKPPTKPHQTAGLELNMGVILADDLSQGLGSAVAATVDVSEPPVAVPLQLPLMPADQLDLLPADKVERQAALRGPRGAGRPAGSINRSTRAWREFLLSRYPSPLQHLAEIYSRPVHDLAAELGCTLLEAGTLQQRAAVDLAPYLHGKMPIEVQVDSNSVLHLVLETPLSAAIEAEAGSLLEGATIVKNQVVSEADDDQV